MAGSSRRKGSRSRQCSGDSQSRQSSSSGQGNWGSQGSRAVLKQKLFFIPVLAVLLSFALILSAFEVVMRHYIEKTTSTEISREFRFMDYYYYGTSPDAEAQLNRKILISLSPCIL